MHRSAYGQEYFLTTETITLHLQWWAARGESAYVGPSLLFPVHEQFRMGVGGAAFGTRGVLYWTGNRWRGGHWPQCGGLLEVGAP